MRKVNNSILHHISNLTTIFLEKQSIASKRMIVFLGHPSKSNDLLVSVFIRRPLTILIYIFNFLKTTKPIAAIFNLKHCYGKRNLNCEIQNLPFLGPHGRGQKRAKFQKSSSLHLHMWNENQCNQHGYDIHEALNLNCDIYKYENV